MPDQAPTPAAPSSLRRGLPRSGHLGGDLRALFTDWLDASRPPRPSIVVLDEEIIDARLVIGQLWNGTDILPRWACDELELRPGSTYAQAVRHVSRAGTI